MSVKVFVTVTGADKKLFKGESLQKGFENKIPVVGLDFGFLVPHDPASGQASGKRQHQPIVFTKEWGASSSRFYAAAYANEVLPSVIFEIYKTSPSGVQQVDHTIKLTDATLSEVSDSLFLGQPGGPPVDSRDLQQITFIFKKIEIDSVATTVEGDTIVADMIATEHPVLLMRPLRFRTRGAS
jgi:type VI secretion system secreted protein Hcp